MEHIGDILKREVPDSKRVSESPCPEPEYQCSICRDVGWVHPMLERGHPDWGKAVPCKCQAEIIDQARKERMLRYCQLPADSEGMTFESFRTSPGLQEAFEAAKATATGDIRWLTLLCKVDRGKTHLAVAICRDRLARGEPAKYAYVPLLLDELRAGYNDDSYQARMQQFLDVSLLVLDDLGLNKKPSDWAMEKLTTIIDYRDINGKDLVVTMNCPINAIPGDEEGRIGSRLQRVRNSLVVAIDDMIVSEYRLVNHA